MSYSLNAVSYTHLDVYKRQIVQFLDAHWEWKLPLVHVPEFFEFYYRPLGAAPQFALAEPVSYTHLDVYKRQEWKFAVKVIRNSRI